MKFIKLDNEENIENLETEYKTDSLRVQKKEVSISSKERTNNNDEEKHISNENLGEEETNLLKKSLLDKKERKKEELPEIDKILEKAGYNFHTLKIIFFTWSILLIDGFHLNFFSSMIIPLTEYYKFSKFHLMILPGIIFIGNTIGSLSISTLLKFFERKILIILAVISSFLFYVLMIFIKSIPMFAVSRFFIGFNIAISTTCSLGILTEYLPIKYRGFVLSSIWSGYTLGQFFMIVIMYYSMPGLEADKSYMTMLISLFIPAIALFSAIIIAQDGPRNLILKNKEDIAFEILEKINKEKIDEEKKKSIIEYTKSGANKRVKGEFLDIFNKEYGKTTTLLTFVRTNHALVSFGVLAINTLTIDYLKKNSDAKYNEMEVEIKNKQILLDEAAIVFIVVISDFWAGIQAEVQFLGRKLSMMVNYIFGLIFMVAAILYSQYFSLLLGFSLCCISVSSIINHTYCLEVYSTKVRDNAMGFLFACRRIGGFIAQILFIYLDGIYIWFPYYNSCGILCINVFLIWFLDKETYAKSIE